MSYILDALKKADAQRERDPARGIHAQPAALPTLQQPGLGQRPWFWAAAAAAVAALAAAGWLLSQERADAQRSAVAATELEAPRHPAVPAAAPAPLGTVAPAPEPAAAAVLPPAAPAPAPAPAPGAPPPVAAPQARTIAPPAETAVRAAPAAKAGPAGATARAAATPQPAAPAAAAPAAVPAPAAPPQAAAPVAPAAPSEPAIANGLPGDAPKLAISGGVYSANRAQRMLIVNGQVVNEGADLGGGIVLEEIRPKAAVLRFRGGRYSVGF